MGEPNDFQSLSYSILIGANVAVFIFAVPILLLAAGFGGSLATITLWLISPVVLFGAAVAAWARKKHNLSIFMLMLLLLSLCYFLNR